MQAGFVSIESLAAYLDTTTPTIRKLVERGVLPKPIELGGLRRWDLDAVRKSVGAALGVVADGRAPTSADPDEANRRAHEKRKGRAGNPRRRND